MTTTDSPTGWAPPTPPPARLLRRSSTDRIGAGVAGGLADYFRVDPVLFRVLFATAAFFGGAGVIAYLLAWAAIPEQGTAHAPVDRVVAWLRHRRLPALALVVVGALVLWALAFSWWVPGPFFPVFLLVIVVVLLFARREPAQSGPPSTPFAPEGPAPFVAQAPDAAGAPFAPEGPVPPAAQAPYASEGPVSLDKSATTPHPHTAAIGAGAATPAGPSWPQDARQWLQESRAASRLRRRRAAPVRWATLGVLAATLTVLALVDAATGIPIPVYGWVTLGIVGLGLLLGMALRRTPWTVSLLLVPAVLSLLAFGATTASLHDGVGQRDWTPQRASAIDDSYRLAFGQGVLDLRSVGTLDGPKDIDVVMAAGQVRILLPATMNATVDATVRAGAITVDGDTLGDSGFGPGHRNDGMGVQHTVLPPAGASGPEVHIDVHLADGEIRVDRS